jgi:hypothetical protein
MKRRRSQEWICISLLLSYLGLASESAAIEDYGQQQKVIMDRESIKTLPLESNFELRVGEIQKRIAEFPFGTQRNQVEDFFKTKDGGLSTVSKTRYFEMPGILVDVPYDDSGGQYSSKNRVNGVIRIHKGCRSLD